MKMNKSYGSLITLGIFLVTACSTDQNRQNAEVNTPEEVKKEQASTADIADVSFIDGMTGKAFHNYLQLQIALFNSDLDEAKKVAGNLSETFTGERANLKNLADQMAEADDLEKVRAAFSAFTNEAEPFFTDALSKGTIYKQYCPMAFNNQGAYWIADVKPISNPYFGDRMAKCGKTVETISK